ncbi:MAG: hypothetical protein JKX69_12015 [Rhodobacteraceae bacterium]|nr:hypothetical protein [Paracoccaceae bacterium]
MIRLLFLCCLAVVPLSAGAVRGHETPSIELVMVEQAGCIWCARWNAEIGPIYPLSREGAQAPLRRIDLFAAELDQLDLAHRVHFTPTFILIQANHEVARLEGYPGEDFFWGIVSKMLEDLAASEPG